jgi:hypothetical protein
MMPDEKPVFPQLSQYVTSEQEDRQGVSGVEGPPRDGGVALRSPKRGEKAMPGNNEASSDSAVRKVFTFGGFDDEHVVGSKECTVGICGQKSGHFDGKFPIACECGGFIHANASLSDVNDPYGGPIRCCDKCGTDFLLRKKV